MDEIITPIIHTELNFEERLHYPRFEVTLSNGRIVYSKPNRRSWLELKSYLGENPSIYIVGLKFAFRDHVETIYTGEADYFFTNSLLAHYGGPTQYFYIGGYMEGKVIRCFKYMIPEVYLKEEFTRSVDDPSVQDGLIKSID